MQKVLVAVAILIALMSLPRVAYARCDTMDGPVVQAGLKALDSRDLDLALIWSNQRTRLSFAPRSRRR